MIITIDGPSGTGKTTIAKAVAKRLGYDYFDSGAMYRAVTHGLLKEHISLDDEEALRLFLKSFSLDMREEKGERHYFLHAEDVTQVIRSPQITAHVSEVAAQPAVRVALVRLQREFAQSHNAVFEGRDMGTVVFPQAGAKFFLTARPDVRAHRRHSELAHDLSREEVLAALHRRDHADSTRQHSPLRQADDAHLIDTSDLTIEEVVEAVLRFIHA